MAKSPGRQAKSLQLREHYWSLNKPFNKLTTGPYANMELVDVVKTLEAHWVVIDAELHEIKKDVNQLRAFSKKYGNAWTASLAHLKRLASQKEALLKEIKFQMELFNLHIQQGRALCGKLDSLSSPIKSNPHPQNEQSQMAIEVISPILANARAPSLIHMEQSVGQ